ncbi:MAG TPA: cytochrome c maturation protein CcmE [Rickettsiales bacterium]|nr:cytochrome c maturation protein CcmE [Rickettsiales bacterium]
MRNKYKKKRLIFISSILAISILALVFIIQNFRNEIVFFYSPSEIKSSQIQEKLRDKIIRVGGLVVEKSVKKSDALTTEFFITDNVANLKIIHKGLTPDLFREKQGVVANGIFDAKQNIFFSQELLVKHDEKYMPPEVAKAVKN